MLSVFAQLNNTFEKALQDVQRKKQDLAKQEEAAVKKKVQLDKQIAKAKATANSHHSSGGAREAELQEEVDKCMVGPPTISTSRLLNRRSLPEHSEMLDLQTEHAEYRPYEVHALCVTYYSRLAQI